ncbi:ABC-type transport system involved in multi-copper enzyme maturation permease subunit [Leucobacter exalbidus]|uniref:ABC-type transport system involved in multi-copper enzyme maturation permease subunit n=1 Tax=Leucobacter exalbidus TaxID=662960 RepID=A0A940T533_9MICO|nr:ABC transporter permease [Leucobacter exalbidus]MBP1327603.1 ABC-type transport system involved in multi-copper enzyme maturation permease subunit [Leucobacter exalbidus]
MSTSQTLAASSPAQLPQAPGFWRGVGVIAGLELQQRRRSRTLWILAAIWFVIIGVVTGITWFILSAGASAYSASFDAYPLFSLIVYFVLLFGTLVAPAISAGSISSERIGGTLATTQVTLISTWSILIGKAVAAWATGIAFLIVAAPFVILSLALARAEPLQLLTAILALILQIGLFTIIGVGLSAMISSPLFSIVIAYLTVAALSLGTLIAFALAVGSTTEYVKVEYQAYSKEFHAGLANCDALRVPETGEATKESAACEQKLPTECVTETTTMSVVHAERFWWLLALNPYVIVGDMVSVRADLGTTDDLFGSISYLVRIAQKPTPADSNIWHECGPNSSWQYDDSTNISDELEGTVPVWWIGLGLQIIIAAGVLWGGYRRLHTPATRLPKGSRIA